MTRQLIVVDAETSALLPSRPAAGSMLFGEMPADTPYGVAVEVAWLNLDTGEGGTFVPKHRVHWVRAYGDPKSLTVCRYLERLVDVTHDDGTEARRLHTQLLDNTLAGSNPAFDARFLPAVFKAAVGDGQDPEPWHHRLCDLAAYAGGVLGVDPRELPGLTAVCEKLGVAPPDHTAAGDVRATSECFLGLARRSAA